MFDVYTYGLPGKGGKTKFTIENVTKTRIVLAESRIHILGTGVLHLEVVASSEREGIDGIERGL